MQPAREVYEIIKIMNTNTCVSTIDWIIIILDKYWYTATTERTN